VASVADPKARLFPGPLLANSSQRINTEDTRVEQAQADFPTIGKGGSKIFQRLEKIDLIFPMIGKTGRPGFQQLED